MIMIKYFNKKPIMTKKMIKILRTQLNVLFFYNDYVDGEAKLKDHWLITRKYKRGSMHKDCNIKVELNHKTPIVFHNRKNYDSHFIMQELPKFDLKITIIPNGLQIYEL